MMRMDVGMVVVKSEETGKNGMSKRYIYDFGVIVMMMLMM